MPGRLQIAREENATTCYCMNILTNNTGVKMKNRTAQIIRNSVVITFSNFIRICGFIFCYFYF